MNTPTRRVIAAAVATACAFVAPQVFAEGSTSVDDAAVQALRAVIGNTDCHEYAGVIIEHAGVFTATAPVRGDEAHFSLSVKLHAGDHLAALYHTHPSCTEPQESLLFSPNDIEQATALNVPSYIGVQLDKSIRKFIPKVTPTEHLSRIGGAKVSRGVLVSQS